jgi:hypothetical protein
MAMPYDLDNPPDKIKNLSPKKQRQFIHVYNSCWDKNHDEELCHKQAWGVTGGSEDDSDEGKEEKKSFNVTSFKKVSKKEKQIEIAKLLLGDEVVSSLRDELQSIHKKAEMGYGTDPFGVDQQEFNPVPESSEAVKEELAESVGSGYANADHNDEEIFEVWIDEETSAIEITPKSPIARGKFNHFKVANFHKNMLEFVDAINIGMPEEQKKYLEDSIKELMEGYHAGLDSSISEEGILRLAPNEDTDMIAQKIYEILSDNNLAGPVARENYQEIQTGPETGQETMASKKFNLKKHADKVFDTIREKEVLNTDLQYLTRHPKSVQEYEQSYIEDYIYRNSVMDKYKPEKVDQETGEYYGGYLEERFHVHKNTEGNSMRARPDGTVPDRPESYSTERRLEEMRDADLRGYTPSEGSETEQQTKKVAKKNKSIAVAVTEDFGLFKASFDGKVMYFDTEEDVETFKRLAACSPTLVVQKKK